MTSIFNQVQLKHFLERNMSFSLLESALWNSSWILTRTTRQKIFLLSDLLWDIKMQNLFMQTMLKYLKCSRKKVSFPKNKYHYPFRWQKQRIINLQGWFFGELHHLNMAVYFNFLGMYENIKKVLTLELL